MKSKTNHKSKLNSKAPFSPNKMKKTSDTIKTKMQNGAYSIGNSIEKVGQKLQENGYNKFGTGIERIGDKIEHMGEPSNNVKIAKGQHV